MPSRRVRIGIDVGGTFTHAVAIDAVNLALVGKVKVPTTHTAAEGVAAGVVASLRALLDACRLTPEEVLFIAHSTTQATNALLEGDVAAVGIIGLGRGAGAVLARRQTHIHPILLAPGRFLKTTHRFVHSDQADDARLNAALDALVAGGAEVIVAAEAFSVDDPTCETRVCELAAARGLPATATHHVSRLHGLGVRTRTAVINASMLPKMLATADMTEQAVRAAGITAPLMIMRSDGGVMDLAQMRRRPILTMLSGPAAGVAAALLYARVSDGVFLEVGGTSTDISVIKNGRCQIRTAEVGGQKLHVSTLDVRTVGLAGGSLVYLKDGRLAQVGPRSSHIAGLPYLSFAEGDPAALRPAPFAHNGETYLAVAAPDGTARAVTTTCASNRLGLVPEGDPAHGHAEVISKGLDVLAPQLGYAGGAALAEAIMQRAAPRVTALIEGLARDYQLDRGVIRLIGGGGGASAVVPYVAKVLGLPCENVANADVISAIGVALALVRDTVERTVITPTEEDIRAIRTAAMESVLRMGAAAETIEVFVEVDTKRNLLRATAEGSTEIRQQELRAAALDEAGRQALVAASMGGARSYPLTPLPGREGPGEGREVASKAPLSRPLPRGERSVRTAPGATNTRGTAAVAPPPPTIAATAASFEVWTAPHTATRLLGLVREQRQAVRVLDAAGKIRWASNHGDVRASTIAAADRDLEDFAEQYTKYTDAGATIPRCFVLLAGRIVDLSGLVAMPQVLEVLRIELKRYGGSEGCVLLVDLA